MTKVSRSETTTRRRTRATVDGDGGEDAVGGTAAAERRAGGAEATTTRDVGGGAWTMRVNAVNAIGGMSGKRRRGRPRRSAKAVMMETKPRAGEERRDTATEAYAEWARRLVMYHMSYYYHHHHQQQQRSLGQFSHYTHGGYGSTMMDYARFQPPNRPDAAPETPHARAEGDASQKQWPIVPQVSTAICPPRSDLVRSTPPGEFGKRQAVNTGVQEASAAKSKAKAQAEARHDDGAARPSRDDQRAAKKATEAAAKRVNEAKALLDPSAALDRSALARDSVQKDMRQRRSTAPSPESSDPTAEQPGSEALGSKGSKSAAVA